MPKSPIPSPPVAALGRTIVAIAVVGLSCCLCTAQTKEPKNRTALVDASLPDYKAQPVPVPTGHPYILPDGSLRIVGFDDMAGMVDRWNAEFTKTHPGVRFTPVLKGNGTAIPAITYDMALFAPEGGGATLLELLPYEKIYGSKKDPVAALIVRVAHGSLHPAAKISPFSIIVNKANPVQSLTMQQVASIFATGSGTGDTTGWSQIGIGGAVADKPIHPVGLYYDAYQRPDDPNMGEYFMYRKMGAFPGYVFSPNYQQFVHYTEVVKAVAADPLAIGIVTENKLDGSVRAVPIAAEAGQAPTTGTVPELLADSYPYGRDLYLYLRRDPGTPFTPLVKEYLRLVLSKQGQMAVAEDPKGYLPLSAKDVRTELDKLDRADTWAPRSKQGPSLNFPFPSPFPDYGAEAPAAK